MKTIAKTYHKYKVETKTEDGVEVLYHYKTPYCLCYFYGENAREWGNTLKHTLSEKIISPIEFLVHNGFKPVTDDTWEL